VKQNSPELSRSAVKKLILQEMRRKGEHS
jgi:hypothetical protein